MNEIELAGLVKNKETGIYDLLFKSFIGSPLLVKERAIEKANDINKFSGREMYDVSDVRIMKRQSITITTHWRDYNEDRPSAQSRANCNTELNTSCVPVYAVVAVTSMADYTEPSCYSSAPDHEEVVALWFSEEKAQEDAGKRNEENRGVVEALECDPTNYEVRKYFVQ